MRHAWTGAIAVLQRIGFVQHAGRGVHARTHALHCLWHGAHAGVVMHKIVDFVLLLCAFVSPGSGAAHVGFDTSHYCTPSFTREQHGQELQA